MFYKIVSTKFEPGHTELRINGEKFYMKGNEERLLYSFTGLLVSVGGFLGLFIGLSLNDVIAFVVEIVSSVEKKFQKV